MNIGIVGGGINGLCCALLLAGKGHKVCLYERNTLLAATSSASSKLLHGGLRYLENREFRLVREALRERDAWIRRVPELAWPVRLVLPIYRQARRPEWMIAAGLFLYDHLAGKSMLPKARKLSAQQIIRRDPSLSQEGLLGGYEFSDAQMNDHELGLWVAEQARTVGVCISENTGIQVVDTEGSLTTTDGRTITHDRVINVAGPWAEQLLHQSGIETPYRLDHIRGSHLVLDASSAQPYLLEVPRLRRIFFVLPWQGKTLVGTTEARQSLSEPIICTVEEQEYLIAAYRHYFPHTEPKVDYSFAGTRPLLRSAREPGRATREYAIHRTGRLISVFGGKWTTAMALAEKVSQTTQDNR